MREVPHYLDNVDAYLAGVRECALELARASQVPEHFIREYPWEQERSSPEKLAQWGKVWEQVIRMWMEEERGKTP